MSVAVEKETLSFQTEVKQLLNLMIKSIYSHKDIFLRELISNASDALDKLRFKALGNDALYENDSDLAIYVEFDEDSKTVTVRDNGIGMSRDEIIKNLGTIARSGTSEFLKTLTGDKAKDSRLIGQFGVGFYSVFIVADKVTVRSRGAGLAANAGVVWSSKGDGEYTVESVELAKRGTEIIIHLKDDESEFLNHMRLRHIITHYSDHIPFPVKMYKPPEPAKGDDEDGDDDKNVAQTIELETVNRATALWLRAKSEIKDEEYHEFYKYISHDFADPLLWTHNRVEGKYEYTSLLFIPEKAPFDLWNRDRKYGLKLYVQRVFILDDAEQFMPSYLRFVRGLIDSNDLPLNISREILQKNRAVDAIKNASVKKILNMLEKLAKDDKEKYAIFWKNFGEVLKEGPAEDYANKEQIAKLLLFSSTKQDSSAQTVSFADYIARMKDGQDKIYYITAENYACANASPHLEIFRKKGIEVLLLTDRVDEWLVSHLTEVQGKTLQSVARGELDIEGADEEEDKTKIEEQNKQFKGLIETIKSALGDRVKDVRMTNRLTDSPACIVVDDNDMGIQMQRILKAAGQAITDSKPILELNPEHKVIVRLESETDNGRISDWAHLLLDQATLAEGGNVSDPSGFVKRLNQLFLEVN